MKIITRILIGIVVVIAALAVCLIGSVFVDQLIGGDRLASVTNTRIANPNGPEIRAYVARPETPGPHPAVIMIHEFLGVNQDIVAKADALAKEGYVVVAPNLFRAGATTWIPRGIYQVITTPQSELNTDLDAVFAWLSTQPDVMPQRVAVMGFCFGGGASLRYSLVNPGLAATAIFYGSPITDPNQLKSLPAPVLGIFGGADPTIPSSQVREFEAALNQAGVPNKITIYEGQPHAFVRAEGIHGADPQGQAWQEFVTFLNETLKQSSSVPRRVYPAQNVPSIGWDYLLPLAFAHLRSAGGGHH